MSERDLVGYGANPPHPRWPNEARVAVQFVLNIEEGAESCILNGDACSEAYLHELQGRPPREGERDLSVEGMYEYGSRAGVWRILHLFGERKLPLTAFAVGRALELNPEIGHALAASGHEIAGHGYRWLDYRGIPEDEERKSSSVSAASAPQAGTRVGSVGIPGACCARKPGCSTARTLTMTTCLTGLMDHRRTS